MHGANMTSLRRLLMINSMGQRASEYEITGNPVSFNTNLSKPLKQMLIPFTPVQSGSGDPSPDNVRPITGWTGVNVYRTGVNLCGGKRFADELKARYPSATIDETNKTISFAYNASTTAGVYFPKVPFKENTQYTFVLAMKNDSVARPNLQIYYTDGTTTNLVDLSTTGTKETVVVTSTANKTILTLNKRSQGGTTVMYYDECGAFEGVVTATDYEPYVGTTIPVAFPAVGKNLFDKAHPNIVYGNFDYNNNVVLESDQRYANVWIPCKPNTTYTVSKVVSKRFVLGTSAETSLTNGSEIDSDVVTGYTKTSLKITTGSDTNTLWVYLFNSDAGDTSLQDILDTLQIEEGSSATAYEEFNNTFYGGTLDLTTGELVRDWVMYDFNKNRTVFDSGQASAGGTYMTQRISVSNRKPIANTPENGDGNGYFNIGDWQKRAISGRYRAYASSSYIYGIFTSLDFDLTTSEGRSDFYDDLESKGIKPWVWFKTKDDYVFRYQLDPVSLSTLIGDNVIFTDTNGENAIKYLKKG